MKPFTLLVAYEVIEFIERLPQKEQLTVRTRFLQIRDFPHNHSDYSEPDSSGRTVQINVYGKFAKYWIDHSDEQVKILDIHRADRRK